MAKAKKKTRTECYYMGADLSRAVARAYAGSSAFYEGAIEVGGQQLEGAILSLKAADFDNKLKLGKERKRLEAVAKKAGKLYKKGASTAEWQKFSSELHKVGTSISDAAVVIRKRHCND